MALSMGSGPFGDAPWGHFDGEAPALPLVYWEPFPKRVRVVSRGTNIVDTRRAVALHETGKMMRICAPRSDVERDFLAHAAFGAPPKTAAALNDHVVIDFDRVDAWYLEDDLGYAHPRDPYHRVDVHRTSRRVVVRAGDVVIAEFTAPALLFETSLAPRYYFPPDAVRTGLLDKSATVSQCPYKGDGQHWHVVVGDRRIEDAGWNLVSPMGDALTIPRWFSFYEDKLQIDVEPS